MHSQACLVSLIRACIPFFSPTTRGVACVQTMHCNVSVSGSALMCVVAALCGLQFAGVGRYGSDCVNFTANC